MHIRRRDFPSWLFAAATGGPAAFATDYRKGAQTGGHDLSLSRRWQDIASATDGVVGAASLDLPSGRYATLNAQTRFPLASVCKLPIAMRALQPVDEHSLDLNRNIDLPSAIDVAHKTGTTDTVKNLNGATNDVGLIMRRGAHPIAIAVYIKGSSRSEEMRDRVIAEIAKATYVQWADTKDLLSS